MFPIVSNVLEKDILLISLIWGRLGQLTWFVQMQSWQIQEVGYFDSCYLRYEQKAGCGGSNCRLNLGKGSIAIHVNWGFWVNGEAGTALLDV